MCRFSKVLSIVPLYSKCTRALTFQNVCWALQDWQKANVYYWWCVLFTTDDASCLLLMMRLVYYWWCVLFTTDDASCLLLMMRLVYYWWCVLFTTDDASCLLQDWQKANGVNVDRVFFTTDADLQYFPFCADFGLWFVWFVWLNPTAYSLSLKLRLVH
jgi:hypothetical protein